MRNRRFQILGAVSCCLAVGFAVLTFVVIVSPAESFDHPGGFTPGGRALAVAGSALAAVVFAVYTVGSLRVVLILDETGLVIRNPFRTTIVRWESKPHFEIRDRSQDVTVLSPGAAWIRSRMTYRYREIICVVGRQRIWIAATSKMRDRDRVDQRLDELRQAHGQLTHPGHVER